MKKIFIVFLLIAINNILTVHAGKSKDYEEKQSSNSLQVLPAPSISSRDLNNIFPSGNNSFNHGNQDNNFEFKAVKCGFCNYEYENWKQDSNDWIEHAKHSPNCKFLHDKMGKHFIETVHLLSVVKKNITPEEIIEDMKRNRFDVSKLYKQGFHKPCKLNSDSHEISYSEPSKAEMPQIQQSSQDKQRSGPLSIKDKARGTRSLQALLVNTNDTNSAAGNSLHQEQVGLADHENCSREVSAPHLRQITQDNNSEFEAVECGFCNYEHENWKQDSNDWIEHAKHSPNCKFLHDKMGKHFIETVHLLSVVKKNITPEEIIEDMKRNRFDVSKLYKQGFHKPCKLNSDSHEISYSEPSKAEMPQIQQSSQDKQRSGPLSIKDKARGTPSLQALGNTNDTNSAAGNSFHQEQAGLADSKNQNNDSESLSGMQPEVARQLYNNMHARKVTFKKWSAHNHVNAVDLAKAGFIYLGVSDRVRCVFCDYEHENWKQGSDPWITHAKNSPNCEFLHQNKGIDFITMAILLDLNDKQTQ
ncbi:MAG: hypothetical protein OXD32_04195 [Endozoicomonadaceae bacterium]|nr:hypothetical protein [Endozoicomonadaceae bacterium]